MTVHYILESEPDEPVGISLACIGNALLLSSPFWVLLAWVLS